MSWSDNLPLSAASDVRKRLLTPETAIQLSADRDTPIGATVSGNVITTGIAHGYSEWQAIQFASTGTVPAPLVAKITYYARDVNTETTFQVSLSIGGLPVTLTTAGTGLITVRNWALNDVIDAKIELGDGYIYSALLALVMDHIRPWSITTWSTFFPIVGYGELPSRTPYERAVIVLDNLVNAEPMNWASVDTAIWLMVQDATLRNQVGIQDTMYDKGPSLESRMMKRADASIASQARLLTVATANGAYGLFNFDTTTDSVTISLL